MGYKKRYSILAILTIIAAVITILVFITGFEHSGQILDYLGIRKNKKDQSSEGISKKALLIAPKVYVKEYSYQASEIDSKISCRVNALEQVKNLLLEELGTYLERRKEVKNFKLTKDQIIILTAGIVRTEIIEERWDFNTYWLKAKIEVDPDELVKSIASLKENPEKMKELEESRQKAVEYLKEIERLKSEPETKGDLNKLREYNEAVKGLSATDWFEKGLAFSNSGNKDDALHAYSKAIEISPTHTGAYINRGILYVEMKKYQEAIND